MNWTLFLKAEAEQTYATTIKLLEKVDMESLPWKPPTGANWMTMGQLLMHLTQACGAPCRAFVGGDFGLPPGVRYEDLKLEEVLPPAEKLPALDNVQDAIRLLLEDEMVALHTIGEAGEEELANREMEAPWEPGVQLPLGLWLFRMIQHLDRHKSQLYYYLKLQGMPMSTADLWGVETRALEPAEEQGDVLGAQAG